MKMSKGGNQAGLSSLFFVFSSVNILNTALKDIWSSASFAIYHFISLFMIKKYLPAIDTYFFLPLSSVYRRKHMGVFSAWLCLPWLGLSNVFLEVLCHLSKSTVDLWSLLFLFLMGFLSSPSIVILS